MKHEKCQCSQPTSRCSRYGWMKGRKWEVCQGINIIEEKRDSLLDAWSQSEPNLLKKVINFANATYQHIQAGLPIVTDEVYNERLSICSSCDEYCDKNKPRWECKHANCGCALMDGEVMPGKARWADQACPIKKWPAEPIKGNVGGGGCCR